MSGRHEGALPWARASKQAGESFGERVRMVRRRWRVVLRLSVSTGLGYLIATQLLGHQHAFFAPIAAVIVTIAGPGLRYRALVELVLGVAVGVLVGELLILSIGRGYWQMGLIVALTIVVGTLVGIKGMALTQAANSAVLLAAVIPVAGSGNPAVVRFVDALVGGVVGLALVLLIPRNAERDIDVEVQTILRRLADSLAVLARALRTSDAQLADAALERARSLQPALEALESTAANVSEIARMAPMRWKQRPRIDLYVGTIRDLDNAVRDTRVLARRVSAMLRHGEAGPPDMQLAIDGLASALRIFAADLVAEATFERARDELVAAARTAVAALPGAMTINSAVVAAQVRSLAADMLLAAGATRDDVDRYLDFD